MYGISQEVNERANTSLERVEEKRFPFATIARLSSFASSLSFPNPQLS